MLDEKLFESLRECFRCWLFRCVRSETRRRRSRCCHSSSSFYDAAKGVFLRIVNNKESVFEEIFTFNHLSKTEANFEFSARSMNTMTMTTMTMATGHVAATSLGTPRPERKVPARRRNLRADGGTRQQKGRAARRQGGGATAARAPLAYLPVA